MRRAFKVSLGLVVLFAALSIVLLAATVYTYDRLTGETMIAELRFDPTGDRQYIAHLRTGDRCLSSWLSPDEYKALVFSEGKWVLTTTANDTQCTNGGVAHREITQEYPLPQSPQDPIPLLTGSGRYTVTGDCPYSSDFDSRVERTGN